MEYKIIYYEKYNITALKKSVTDIDERWLLFVENGATLAEDAVEQLEKAVQVARDNVAAFELRQSPVDSGHHTDPVTLEIPYLATAAFLVKRTAFEKAGGFDDNFNLLSFVDLSWRLRVLGYTLQACPFAVVYCDVQPDERYEYIYGQYERLLLGCKWGRDGPAKEEFEQTLKTPRHFPGVRKELAKLYATHFTKVLSLKKFRKTALYNPAVCDFSQNYRPFRDTQAFSEPQTQPLVSVVVRTHKRKEVLRRTLMCLRNQIYKNFEIVVVEDGENTAEEMIKADFADLNINYYSTGVNVGRGRAGNIGIERAKGEFVSFLDDDDFYYADHISAFVSVFQSNPGADVIIGGGMAYETNILSVDPYEFTVENMYPIIFDHITLMDMCVRCRIPMPCAMFRKQMYEKCGGMREDIGGDEDWAMWLKFISKGNRINLYNCDIKRALALFGYPADKEAARKREEIYREFDRTMLYDESLVFDVHGSEVQKWEQYVAADVGHLKNIGQLDSFIETLKPLGVEKLEYNPEGMNKLSAKQINNYYYWLVQEYSK